MYVQYPVKTGYRVKRVSDNCGGVRQLGVGLETFRKFQGADNAFWC